MGWWALAIVVGSCSEILVGWKMRLGLGAVLLSQEITWIPVYYSGKSCAGERADSGQATRHRF